MIRNMMDYVKTGSFIARMRKKQGLTQRQLSEMLNISDKTVSKWETGRSAPDNSVMMELCEILKISVNELLSGETIPEDVYISRAEKNFVELIKEGEDRANGERLARVGVVIGFLLLLVILAVTLLGLTKGYRYIAWYLDPVSFAFIIVVTVLILYISGMIPDFFRAILISCGGKMTVSKNTVKRALTAVNAALSACLLSGVLAFLAGFILLTKAQKHMEDIVLSMGAAALPVFYGVLFALLLLPAKVRLKKILSDGKCLSE